MADQLLYQRVDAGNVTLVDQGIGSREVGFVINNDFLFNSLQLFVQFSKVACILLAEDDVEAG
jgi:hypothetical protein